MAEISDLNHQCFLEHLKASEPARWRVARWLVALGYTVLLKPMDSAPDVAESQKFIDDGDIEASMRVEAKQLSRDFTSRKDWPFGDKFIVCSRSSFDNAKRKPRCYMIINRAGTHAAIVLSSSHKSWRIETRRDGRYPKYKQEFYFAPMDKVTFCSMEDVSDNANANQEVIQHQ